MDSYVQPALVLTSTVGCGLMAGTFFAFSAFVTRALASLPAPHGIAAFQSINTTVLNPVFLGVFLGTAGLCIALGIHSVLSWSRPGAAWLLGGSLLYLLGNVVVTGVGNVPLNDALAAVDPASTEAAKVWRDFLASWPGWNHVRTVTATAAMAAFMVGLILSRAHDAAL